MTENAVFVLTSTITETFKKNIKKLKKVANSFEKRNGQFVSLQRENTDGHGTNPRPTPPLPTGRELSYSFIEER